MKFAALMIAAVGVAEAHYKSGAVTGYEKFTYGKFITRMKAPAKLGTVSSFFTYWNGPNFYEGGWNELDLEIVPSKKQSPMSMNAIYGDGNHKLESHDYLRRFDPKDEWHIYEMVWHPKYIAWSVDGREMHRLENENPATKYLNKEQSIMMNFWTPTFEAWAAGFDGKDMPWTVEYDYVEAYTFNSATGGFDFHWKDDFNTFDTSKWHKADNTTFDANSSIFRASQVSVKDSKLILKMEPDPAAESYHGTRPSYTPVMGMPSVHSDFSHQSYHYDPYSHHSTGFDYVHGFHPTEHHQYADDIIMPESADFGLGGIGHHYSPELSRQFGPHHYDGIEDSQHTEGDLNEESNYYYGREPRQDEHPHVEVIADYDHRPYSHDVSSPVQHEYSHESPHHSVTYHPHHEQFGSVEYELPHFAEAHDW